MEEKIIFLTKEQLKKMIDETPGDLIPVSIVKADGGDNGGFLKVCKGKCHIYVDESKSITCEFGNIFNNIALYSISQMDINRLSRNGTEVRKQQILDKYTFNNMEKLKRISYPLFIKFGGITDKDYDEFYSIANMELWKATDVFDESEGVSFENYLKGCLSRKFKTELTRMNRDKRKSKIRCVNGNGEEEISYVDDLSFDTPIGDESGGTLGDILSSDFDMDKELYNLESIPKCGKPLLDRGYSSPLHTSNAMQNGKYNSDRIRLSTEKGFDDYSPKMKEYLHSLSKVQLKVLEYISEGYNPEEIQELLHIDSALYKDSIAAITSNRNTRKIQSLIRR